MARMILALAICGGALAITPAAAQSEKPAAAPALPLARPAPYNAPTGSIEAPVPGDKPIAEG